MPFDSKSIPFFLFLTSAAILLNGTPLFKRKSIVAFPKFRVASVIKIIIAFVRLL
jgi:hypothetical protein